MKRDLTASACILAGCILMYKEAASLPEPRFELLGPAFFPKLVLTGIIAFTLLDIVVTIVKNVRANAVAKTAGDQPAESVDTPAEEADSRQKPTSVYTGIVLPSIIIVYFVVYSLLISYSPIPYLILTFVYILITSWTLAFFSKKSFLPSALTALGVTAFIYFGFVYGLELILP